MAWMKATFKISGRGGARLSLSTYGATVLSLLLPDRKGRLADVVLGHEKIADYALATGRPYFGSTIGRFANRIAAAKFRLGKALYSLGQNDGRNSLHGGQRGFDSKVWKAKPISGKGWKGVRFSRLSPDGEEGYPGNLKAKVEYKLMEDKSFSFEAWASSDRSTPVNLCNHNYYNLAGEGSGTVLKQLLWINADTYTPLSAGLIPTGKLAKVAGTPFDFRGSKAVGRDLGLKHPQLALAGGYDHNFVLNKKSLKDGMSLAATLYDPPSGRHMEIWTTEPGIQFYSGNSLSQRLKGKSGQPYRRHSGLCLETQHFPNSPNIPSFPNTILHPGKSYHSKTLIRFSVR